MSATITMDQQTALNDIQTKAQGSMPPEMWSMLTGQIDDSLQAFDGSKVVKVGTKFPSFEMADATGKQVSSQELLKQGAFLMAFYRGEWCPYCNVAIQYLQRHLEDFKARGVTLVAVTPENPDYTLTMTEKHDLKFPVLTDANNKLAKQLGIIYNQAWARGFHAKLGIDLNARNNEDTWEVPSPAVILVDKTGTVRNVYLDPDFRNRMDPKVALKWADDLKA